MIYNVIAIIQTPVVLYYWQRKNKVPLPRFQLSLSLCLSLSLWFSRLACAIRISHKVSLHVYIYICNV